MYGRPIGITYKGRRSYKTTLGAAISLVVITVLTGYFLYRAYVMIAKQNSNVADIDFILDLNSEGSFYPGNVGFDFAFGTGD